MNERPVITRGTAEIIVPDKLGIPHVVPVEVGRHVLRAGSKIVSSGAQRPPKHLNDEPDMVGHKGWAKAPIPVKRGSTRLLG
jgi:hypothetical protein